MKLLKLSKTIQNYHFTLETIQNYHFSIFHFRKNVKYHHLYNQVNASQSKIKPIISMTNDYTSNTQHLHLFQSQQNSLFFSNKQKLYSNTISVHRRSVHQNLLKKWYKTYQEAEWKLASFHHFQSAVCFRPSYYA